LGKVSKESLLPPRHAPILGHGKEGSLGILVVVEVIAMAMVLVVKRAPPPHPGHAHERACELEGIVVIFGSLEQRHVTWVVNPHDKEPYGEESVKGDTPPRRPKHGDPGAERAKELNSSSEIAWTRIGRDMCIDLLSHLILPDICMKAAAAVKKILE
jgi:hypothetical protein